MTSLVPFRCLQQVWLKFDSELRMHGNWSLQLKLLTDQVLTLWNDVTLFILGDGFMVLLHPIGP